MVAETSSEVYIPKKSKSTSYDFPSVFNDFSFWSLWSDIKGRIQTEFNLSSHRRRILQ